ncbi:Mettl5, partial [Symbiodinium sp. KB8]
ALNHLHLATDSLSRALASGETSPAGEWTLVPNPPLVLDCVPLCISLPLASRADRARRAFLAGQSVPPQFATVSLLKVRMTSPADALAFASSGAVPPTLLAQGNAGDPDAMFGPSTLLTVPAMEEQEDGAEVATETSIEVLIVDFSDAAASFLEPFDPLSLEDPVPFSEEAPQVFPECRQLVALSKSWVRTAEGERIAFYSAQEGEEEAPGLVDPVEAPAATAKAKAKRVTTAQLAEQLGSISQLLPTISDRLQDLAERQKELETK